MKLQFQPSKLGKGSGLSGFTLLELLIGMLLSGVLMGFVLSLGKITIGQQVQAKLSYFGEQIRRNLVAHIENSDAWRNTVSDAANNSFSCLRTPGVSCAGFGGPFRIRDAANTLVYDALGTNGFTNSGAPCNSFDAANGNDACPLAVRLSWQPLCTGTCTNPQVKVTGKLVYKPKSGGRNVAVLNGESYSFEVIQSAPQVTPISSGSPLPNTIICAKRDYFPQTGCAYRVGCSRGVRLSYRADECGGNLPDTSYVGMLSKTEVCGADESFEVVQPGEAGGPGISFWFLGDCPSPASASNLQVVFIRK